MPPDELNKNLIDKQRNANAEAFKGAGMGDLIDKNSGVYRAPEVVRDPTPLPEKPKFDGDGFPVIENVRTYQEDIANAVKNENVSVSKMMMAEGARRDKQGIAVEESKRGFRWHIVLGAFASLFFLGGIGAVGYSFMVKNKADAPVVEVPTKSEILSYNQQTKISVIAKKREDFLGAILKEIQNAPKDASLRKVDFVSTVEEKEVLVALPEFVATLDLRAPDRLVRNLSDEFFFGINFIGQGSPFIIAKTASYDIAYPGLLDWEKTLVDDFKEIVETDPLKNYTFKDRIILNKDVRSLEDGAGNIIFYYTFIDQNTIFFGKDTDSLKEVLERLRLMRLKK